MGDYDILFMVIGLSAVYNTIIELAAVKVKNGEIIDRFESFADPHEPLTNTIIELTGITDDMVRGAPDQIQTKFRDERRPRFGLLRGREFIMKDAY